MNTALRKEILSEVYQDLQEAITYTVLGFVRRYGGDFEELRADANLLFVQAYDKHDESKGSLVTWVKFYVFKNLLEKLRSRLYRQAAHGRSNKDVLTLPAPAEFGLMEFLDGLPLEVAAVVKMTLDPPPDVLLSVEQLGGFKPHRVRNAIREFLKDLGWASSQITDLFQNIREVLS